MLKDINYCCKTLRFIYLQCLAYAFDDATTDKRPLCKKNFLQKLAHIKIQSSTAATAVTLFHSGQYHTN